MGADVAARFRAGSSVPDDVWHWASAVRARLRIDMREMLAGALLILPSAPTPAPSLLDADDDAAQARRAAILQLTCLAGHIGAPALSLPLATVRRLPVGVSLIALPGADEALLRAAFSATQSGRVERMP